MAERKLFGTDGIRGQANTYPMTGELAFVLGRAVTHFFRTHSKKNKLPLIVLGKDTRRSCYMLEQAFSAGVCAQGGKVVLTGPLPTPGVAFCAKSLRADAGVMISASHNNFSDNGIKLFDSAGYKLPDEAELQIEELTLNPELMPVPTGEGLGRAKRLTEVFGRYLVHAKLALSSSYDMTGLRIVLDCANGAAYKVTPMMFHELGAETFLLGVNPNGININLECGSMHPNYAADQVIRYRADMGICLDGDADRLVVIDELGEIIDGDKLIALFAKHLLESGSLKKGDVVVGTIMSNLGLEVYLKKIGLKFHRTKVGDRYIIDHMRKNGNLLGGEPSGHIIFSEHATTGDGSLAALKLVECVRFYNKPVSKLVSDIELFPQKLVNLKVAKRPPLQEVEAIQSVKEKVEKEMGDRGRVVLRYSGTEKICRVMVEGDEEEMVNNACHSLCTIVNQEIGQLKSMG